MTLEMKSPHTIDLFNEIHFDASKIETKFKECRFRSPLSNLNMRKSTVCIVFYNDKLYPYKMSFVNELVEDDFHCKHI